MNATPLLDVGPWRLRPLRLDDADAWLAVVDDPDVRRLTGWSLTTVDEMRRNIASYLEGPRAATTRRWAIVDDGGAFCGTCGFKDWDHDAGFAELSYELAARHRRRGAMTAIAGAVIAHGHREMGLGTILALVNVENTPSQRLLEKLAFQRTATLPAFRSCGGVVRDFYRYERAAP